MRCPWGCWGKVWGVPRAGGNKGVLGGRLERGYGVSVGLVATGVSLGGAGGGLWGVRRAGGNWGAPGDAGEGAMGCPWGCCGGYGVPLGMTGVVGGDHGASGGVGGVWPWGSWVLLAPGGH